MSKVIDFTKRRERRDQLRRQDRPPDFVMEGWLEKGELESMWLRIADKDIAAWRHDMCTAMLIDAAWMYAMRDDDTLTEADRPVLWYFLDAAGRSQMVVQRGQLHGTNWRQATWWVRNWWRMSRRWWGYVRRVVRGKG